MREDQKGVVAFQDMIGVARTESPTICDPVVLQGKIDFLREELNELEDALKKPVEQLMSEINDDGTNMFVRYHEAYGRSEKLIRLTLIADALADLKYVANDFALRCGIDLEPVEKEVQRSNMTKEGGHFREDGKYIKPDTYEPAIVRPIIAFQMSAGIHRPDDTTLSAQELDAEIEKSALGQNKEEGEE
jgi:predicted HAD superfamily Cof-like phosphohydrolase